MTEAETTHILSLRDVASWQFPALVTDSQGQRHPPKVLAGLPSLQRGAVWRPNQVELLWDSILRGFPIGSLVVTRKLKRQKTRSGAHADALPWGDAYTDHLLDGQQRANAIALGYLDPFAFAPAVKESPQTLLWLDLMPSGVELEQLSLQPVPGFAPSTRSYLLRVTTQAHPWGFKVSDEKEPKRLKHWQAREAKAIFLGPESNAHDRPMPNQGWPIEANAPIPLAWALEAAHQVADRQPAPATDEPSERALWKTVHQRCAAHSQQTAVEVDDPRFTPWAQRAMRVLTHWLDAETLPLQAKHLAHALLRAMQARIVALPIAPEALEEPYRPSEKQAQEDVIPIANVEHLFQRLNGGGTDLSAEDRAYSMIKAYWPGIEGTINKIEPRPPETQVALLGTRLALDLAKKAEDKTLPAQPSVSSLRQLATAQVSDSKNPPELMEQRKQKQIRTMFGLSKAENANDAPIKKAIERWDSWFLYSEDRQPWGLPPVLRSRMASHAPEVFLFLLRLTHYAKDTPPKTVRRKLLGLATAVHWFGLEREKAVRWLWIKPPVQWLDGSAFSKVLSEIRYSGQAQEPNSKPTMARILHPDELANYISLDTINSSPIEVWQWRKSLIMEPAHEEARKNNPEATQKELGDAVNSRWAEYGDFIDIVARRGYQGTNALLLMYAQREQMQHYFSDYDPQDADFWAAHNVPWDFDHLLQQNAFTNKKADNAFIYVCQECGNTIANLHLLPFEQNRSRQDAELKTILPSDTAERAEFLRRIYLTTETSDEANKLSAFSMGSDDIRSNLPEARQRVTDFVLGSHARLLSLYRNWFDELKIGSLL